MSVISGVLRVGEASASVRAIMARQGSATVYLWVLMIGLFVIGAGLGLLVAQLVANGDTPNYRTGVLGGMIVGGIAYFAMRRSFAMRRFRKNFQARHHTLELPLRVEISEESLTYELGGVTVTARWNVVDEIFFSHDYWILSAQAQVVFAPQRFFAGLEAEKQFVKAALSHMSAEARTRSAEAMRFAGL